MTLKRIKGKFRLSSSSSVSSQLSIEEWSKHDDKVMECINRADDAKLRQVLNKKGVSPVKSNRDGQTALHVAVKKGLVECVDIMLTEHPDLSTEDLYGQTVYHIAAANSDVIMLKKLLDYSRWNLEIKDTREMSALHYAVGSGEIACVKLLLDNNSPMDVRDSNYRTPLLLAITEAYEKIALCLILHGADISLPDNMGRTPLIVACTQGMSQVVALLISKGATTEKQDHSLEKLASDNGHKGVLDILRNGAEVNGNDKPGIEETSSMKDFLRTNGDSSPVNFLRERPSPTVPRTNSTTQKHTQDTYMNFDDNSFTSSIIESLRGFEVDSVSLSSPTEDQIHAKEKRRIESLEKDLRKKDLQITELEVELTSMRNKLKTERDQRFAAEAEYQHVKLQLEDALVTGRVATPDDGHVTFDSDSHLLGDTTDGCDEHTTDSDPVENTNMADYVTRKDTCDSDESISRETGYRKKSLGTAKQHIEMLEEHVLTLEEEIVNKDREICELETKLLSSQELIELDRTTTVTLDVYNQLKSEMKGERSAFKNEVRALDEQLKESRNKIETVQSENAKLTHQSQTENAHFTECRERLESQLAAYQRELSETKCKVNEEKLKERIGYEEGMKCLEDTVEDFTEKIKDVQLEKLNVENQLRSFQDQLTVTSHQLNAVRTMHEVTIATYRTHMLSLYKGALDPGLTEVLSRIARLRGS